MYQWGEIGLAGVCETTPLAISGFDDSPIVAVSSGFYYTLAIDGMRVAGSVWKLPYADCRCCAESGRTYSWGKGGHGVLGHGSTETRAFPTVITDLANHQIVGVASGGLHSMAWAGMQHSKELA